MYNYALGMMNVDFNRLIYKSTRKLKLYEKTAWDGPLNDKWKHILFMTQLQR